MSSPAYDPPADAAASQRGEERTHSRASSTQDARAKAAGRSASASRPAPHAATDKDSARPQAGPGSGSTRVHRHFVFTDPVAFRYLEDDPATVVLERRGRLNGYQLYLVEQWACSRVHPTFVIATFTGDPSHSVLVGVLGVPADENRWSARLRVYFNAISQFHARAKETPLGLLMVTNLSGFPSALTVIPVPDGDIKRHRESFIVNENLKRLGCSGRSGLSLSLPASATQAKFHQLYKTSQHIDLYSAVIELVKLCQVALMMFGKLLQEYADGLLCDVTERAISDWWTEFGTEYYNIEPADGILGPTTVSALLGMLMGARNRLNYFGAPVAKDAFDIACLKRGTAYFQKSQKLDRTRRLDRQTLACLRRVTAKAASGESWAVPKAVKSTVAELGGKGGEMMMGFVGARDKAGISDIETLDIDLFVSLLQGERAKWLWHGKRKRSGASDNFGKPSSENGNMTFGKDYSGGYLWSNRRNESFPVEDEDEVRRKEGVNTLYPVRSRGSAGSVAETSDRDQRRKTVFKSVSGKMSDARTGFGRIKDAVGLRGHASRQSRDYTLEEEGQTSGYLSPGSANLDPSAYSAMQENAGKVSASKSKLEETQDGYRRDESSIIDTPHARRERGSESPPPSDSKSSLPLPLDFTKNEIRQKEQETKAVRRGQPKELLNAIAAAPTPVSDAVSQERGRNCRSFSLGTACYGGGFSYGEDTESSPVMTGNHARNDAWWPRHLSFSEVEEAVLTRPGENGVGDAPVTDSGDNKRYLAEEERLPNKVAELREYLSQWVETKVARVEALENQTTDDHKEFQGLYCQLKEIYQSVQESSLDLLTEERSHLTEATKDLEGLGAKLEYQINALAFKVADAEDGVTQFESQVDSLESYSRELELVLQKEGWLHWAMRTLTGIGIGPHLATG